MIILIGLGYYLLMDSFTEWNYNLDKTKKNPYGTFVTYELLKSKFKKKGFKEIDTLSLKAYANSKRTRPIITFSSTKCLITIPLR